MRFVEADRQEKLFIFDTSQGLNCSEMATAWADVNTTYYDMIKNDPKLQGNYTKDGKLFLGWIC